MIENPRTTIFLMLLLTIYNLLVACSLQYSQSTCPPAVAGRAFEAIT
eukprot:SAG31_NODE_18030_length_649_cov_0.823636_2_plen_46_part_01